MGDTSMNAMHNSVETLRQFDAVFGDLSPDRAGETNESSGDPTEDPDCTIDDEQKAQHHTVMKCTMSRSSQSYPVGRLRTYNLDSE